MESDTAYCGECGAEMEQVGVDKFQCPSCEERDFMRETIRMLLRNWVWPSRMRTHDEWRALKMAYLSLVRPAEMDEAEWRSNIGDGDINPLDW